MSEEGRPALASLRGHRAGFLMIDLLLALAVMALIAALALPFVRAGGEARLRVTATEIASLLRSSRNAALLSGRSSAVTIDTAGGIVRSRVPASVVAVPRGIALAVLPPNAAIAFAGDGRSSGGAIVLSAGSSRVVVRVNPLTAAVQLSAP